MSSLRDQILGGNLIEGTVTTSDNVVVCFIRHREGVGPARTLGWMVRADNVPYSATVTQAPAGGPGILWFPDNHARLPARIEGYGDDVDEVVRAIDTVADTARRTGAFGPWKPH
ncbi:hypothetical protein ACIBCO_41210 [Streptomyces violascens]|uniref:hypothetical protein n=1 Tax=Streptomyces violascens TaxID=67381 RepID=UPI0037B22EF7